MNFPLTKKYIALYAAELTEEQLVKVNELREQIHKTVQIRSDLKQKEMIEADKDERAIQPREAQIEDEFFANEGEQQPEEEVKPVEIDQAGEKKREKKAHRKKVKEEKEGIFINPRNYRMKKVDMKSKPTMIKF